MAWLDDHPPRRQQFRCPRRRAPSGIIGVHTAESFPDETGPDTGAESVAGFIQRRTNYGSYHDLCDSDSIINLVQYDCVAYHIATYSLNEHTYGVSAATQASKWDSLGDDWVDATVQNMARASARYARWFRNRYGKTIPARRRTLSQVLAGQMGFIAHGDADPARRTDPGPTFPWTQFLNNYAALMRGDDLEDDDMPSPKDWTSADWDAFNEKAGWGRQFRTVANKDMTDVLQEARDNAAEARDSAKNAVEAAAGILGEQIVGFPDSSGKEAKIPYAIEQIWRELRLLSESLADNTKE